VLKGDSLDPGGKVLRLIEALWFHWLETLFTYMLEARVTFSCDFFGAHTAQGIYEDNIEELVPLAKCYYGKLGELFHSYPK
jgi:flavorubredoxin